MPQLAILFINYMFFLGLLDTLEEKAQRFVISGPYFFDDVTANYSKPKSSTILMISAFFRYQVMPHAATMEVKRSVFIPVSDCCRGSHCFL